MNTSSESVRGLYPLPVSSVPSLYAETVLSVTILILWKICSLSDSLWCNPSIKGRRRQNKIMLTEMGCSAPPLPPWHTEENFAETTAEWKSLWAWIWWQTDPTHWHLGTPEKEAGIKIKVTLQITQIARDHTERGKKLNKQKTADLRMPQKHGSLYNSGR